MKKILIFIVAALLMSCTKTIYVPVQGENKIEYRDSVIHIVDSVKVPIPVEKVVEIVPELDTSRLETSIAYSEAFLDTKTRKLNHTLKNKETALKGKLDTIVRVEYINKYIEKVVVQEVPVPERYIPTLYKYSMWFSVIVILLVGVRLFLKFKTGGLL